jgi:diguanylate cyclase (GGDEF)-like protein/PAS domain S-box-containing protein
MPEEGSEREPGLDGPDGLPPDGAVSTGGLPGIEARYRALVEHIPAVTYIDAVDRTSTALFMSPQVEEMLGYPLQRWLDDSDLWIELLHPEDRDRVVAEHLRTNHTGDRFVEEYRLLARDGRVVWVRDQAVLVRAEDEGGAFWQGVLLDITDRKRAEEQVRFLAYHDSLTELPNRPMFEEALHLALERGRRRGLGVAVLYIDLDQFKLVNDSLGHNAGDDLLREVAARLRSANREEDLVARQGGDEFLVLIADLPVGRDDGADGTDQVVEAAGKVAQRIRNALSEPVVIDDTELLISASIGVAAATRGARSAEALLHEADSAMYRAKRTAPGRYAFFSGEESDPLTRLSLATRLRRAADREEWVLRYQPIVDMRRGRLVGVEALLRWRQPDGELVLPDEFLPAAEELGLMRPIGDWVIDEVTRQAAAWRDEGVEIEVAFNVSIGQLWQPDITERLRERLDAARLPPGRIIVEITETTAMTDANRTFRILSDLHEFGARLAIDDFGTGYSSLSRLRQLPVDILKIDRPFVRHLGFDRQAESTMRAIIQLAEGLNMTPLVEGVESTLQRDFVVAQGCRLGQGYLFGRPMAPEEIARETP